MLNNPDHSAATTDHPLSVVAERFHQTTTGTLGDRAYHVLRSAILVGDIPPHYALHEIEIASVIPISRTPIREALKRLRAEGLLIAGANRGLKVRDLDLRECLSTYQILEVLEPLATRLAAMRITDKELAELNQSVDLVEFFSGRDRWEDITRESQRFHRLIYETSGNAKLARLIIRLREETHRFRRFRIRRPELVSRAAVEDRQIVEALARRDAEDAHRVMYEHILLSTIMIQSLIDDGETLDIPG